MDRSGHADGAEDATARSGTGVAVAGGLLVVAGGAVLLTTPAERGGHLEGDGRYPSNFSERAPQLAIGVVLVGVGAALAISGAATRSRSDP